MPHSYNVITKHADFKEYIALKHLVQIQGYVTDVYLPIDDAYDPRTRTGSIYNSKSHGSNGLGDFCLKCSEEAEYYVNAMKGRGFHGTR